jgi:hypothetical protein
MLPDERWAGPGIHSAAHWIQWQTGANSTRAAQLLAIAERVDELSACMSLFDRGELSVDQMHVIAARCPGAHDGEMAKLAVSLSVAQLRTVCRRWNRPRTKAATEPTPDRPEPVPGDPAMAPGHLSWWFDDDGRFHLLVDAPTADGLILEAALAEARDALFRAGDEKVTDHDALMEMAHRSLASIGLASRADRFRVYLFLDTEGAWTTNGTRLPQALLDQIVTNGVVQPVWTTAGVPVNVGRASRTIPAHLRRLIHERDGGRCRTPSCTNTVGLDVHHYRWWRHGGPTDLENLGLQCRRCHEQIHRGDLIATGNPNLGPDDADGLRFSRRDGSPLTHVRRFVPPLTAPPAGRWIRPTHERLEERWVHFREPPVDPADTSPYN